MIGLASDCWSVCLRVELWPLKLSPQLNPILRQAVASFEHDLYMASIRLKLALCGLVTVCLRIELVPSIWELQTHVNQKRLRMCFSDVVTTKGLWYQIIRIS